MQKLKKPQVFFLIVLVIGFLSAVANNLLADEKHTNNNLALVVEVEGVIGPSTVRHIEKSIEEAQARNAEVIVLRLNTPGGLVDSTRQITSAILESSIPIIGYVSPAGAHAASAGTYIMYATHVAAMAPGTNLGAATPVAIGINPSTTPEKDKSSDEEDSDNEKPAESPVPSSTGETLAIKSINDAVSYIKSLAEMRGRNAEWAEKAVREAATLTATEALKENVIEIIAVDIEELLDAANGREVILGRTTYTLKTTNLVIEIFKPDFLTKALEVLSNPNVALILMMIGVYGLFFEFANPGTIGPGVAGAISLILGLYALNQLPLDYTGLILILLGIAFMVAEAFTPTMGALGAGGIVSFIIGAAILIDTENPAFQISWSVIIGTAVVSGAILILLLGYVWRAHHRPIASGAEHLIGAEAQVMEWRGTGGFVWAEGERWKATGAARLKPGTQVKIKALKGLTVIVGEAKDQKIKKDKKGA